MSVSLALSSAVSGVLLGAFLFSPGPPVEVGEAATTTFGHLRVSSRTSTAAPAPVSLLFETRFEAVPAEREAFAGWQVLVVYAVIALIIFGIGYGVGSFRRSSSGQGKRARARVLEGSSVARSPNRSALRDGPELRS